MSSPAQNLSKNTGRQVENTNTKGSFFHCSSKINKYYFIIFLRRTILDLKFLLMQFILTHQHKTLHYSNIVGKNHWVTPRKRSSTNFIKNSEEKMLGEKHEFLWITSRSSDDSCRYCRLHLARSSDERYLNKCTGKET